MKKEINWSKWTAIALFLLLGFFVAVYTIPPVWARIVQHNEVKVYDAETADARAALIRQDRSLQGPEKNGWVVLPSQAKFKIAVVPPELLNTAFSSISYRRAVGEGLPIRYFKVLRVDPSGSLNPETHAEITDYYVMVKTRKDEWKTIEHKVGKVKWVMNKS